MKQIFLALILLLSVASCKKETEKPVNQPYSRLEVTYKGLPSDTFTIAINVNAETVYMPSDANTLAVTKFFKKKSGDKITIKAHHTANFIVSVDEVMERADNVKEYTYIVQ